MRFHYMETLVRSRTNEGIADPAFVMHPAATSAPAPVVRNRLRVRPLSVKLLSFFIRNLLIFKETDHDD